MSSICPLIAHCPEYGILRSRLLTCSGMCILGLLDPLVCVGILMMDPTHRVNKELMARSMGGGSFYSLCPVTNGRTYDSKKTSSIKRNTLHHSQGRRQRAQEGTIAPTGAGPAGGAGLGRGTAAGQRVGVAHLQVAVDEVGVDRLHDLGRHCQGDGRTAPRSPAQRAAEPVWAAHCKEAGRGEADGTVERTHGLHVPSCK